LALTTAETIAELTGAAVLNGEATIVGQCLTAVGWVGGTVPQLPDHPGIVELSMADVAGGGIAVGMALAGVPRPIYVVRYQGFLWYNAPSLVNYAAKSRELWGVPCPILVRGIAMEGAIGPVAGSTQHSLVVRMPGLNVCSPITPSEWREAWRRYWLSDDPWFFSEHRKSFGLTEELPTVRRAQPTLTVLALSGVRMDAQSAVARLHERGIEVDLFHQVWIEPREWPDGLLESLTATGRGLVVDADFAQYGLSQSLAHDLMLETGARVETAGLSRRSAGFSKASDNLPPDVEELEALFRSVAQYPSEGGS